MINHQPEETGQPPGKAMTEDGSNEIVPAVSQTGDRLVDAGEKLKPEPGRDMERANRGMAICWLFIAVIVIGSAIAGYLLWVKLSLRFR
jgi:hypothetical protein